MHGSQDGIDFWEYAELRQIFDVADRHRRSQIDTYVCVFLAWLSDAVIYDGCMCIVYVFLNSRFHTYIWFKNLLLQLTLFFL